MLSAQSALLAAVTAMALTGCGGATDPGAGRATSPTASSSPRVAGDAGAARCRAFSREFARFGEAVTALPPPAGGRLVPEAEAEFQELARASSGLAEGADPRLAAALRGVAGAAEDVATGAATGVRALNDAVDGVQEACGPT